MNGIERVKHDLQSPRVIIITPSSELGGAERNIALIASRLGKGKYSPLLITCSGSGELLDCCSRAGWETAEYRVFDTPTAWPALVSRVRREKPVLIHSYLLRGNWIAWSLTRLVRTGWIAAERSMDVTRPPWKVGVNARLLRSADRVLAVSEPVRDILIRRERLTADRVHVLPGGVEPLGEPLPLTPEMLGLARPRLVCLGHLRREKNQRLALSALAHLHGSGCPATLTFLGDGKERARLEQEAEARGLGRHVLFAGKHIEARRFLPHFDLLLIPSSEEAFPNAMLEGWLAEIPVVSTDTGGAAAMEGGSGAACLAPEADIPARILGLLRDDASRAALVEAGRKRVREFSIDSVIPRMLAHWDAVAIR